MAAFHIKVEFDSVIRGMADQGHYPRAAVLETLIGFIVSDLESR